MAENRFTKYLPAAPAGDDAASAPPATPTPAEVVPMEAAPAPASANRFAKYVPAAEPAPATEPPSRLESLGRGALAGGSLNFADEGAGVIAASPLTGSGAEYAAPLANMALGGARLLTDKLGLTSGAGQKAYDEAVARERAANEAARMANPGTYFTGELLGGLASAPVAPGLAPLKVAANAGRLARAGAAAGNMAATGAAYGAVSGAGGAEGDALERLPGTAQGGAIGVVAGPAIGGAIKGGIGIGRFVGNHLAASFIPQRVGDRITARALERDSADAGSLADQIEADQIQKYGPLPDSHAIINGVPHELRPDGTVGAPLPEINPLGVQNITAADIAGPNTRAAATNAVRMPGPGRAEGQQFLINRQAGTPLEDAQAGALDMPSQADRVTDRLSEIGGSGTPEATSDQILARRSADGERLYEGPNGPMSATIDYGSAEGKTLAGLYERIAAGAPEAIAKAKRILGMRGETPEQPANGAPAAPAPTRAGAAAPNQPTPDSLSRFIARNGGLSLEGGDAAAAGYDKVNIPGVGRLAKPGGKSIDNFWRERLIEEGYLPPDEDGGMARDITNELFDALHRDRSGDKVYPEGFVPKGGPRMSRNERDALDQIRGDVVRDLLTSGHKLEDIDPARLDDAAKLVAGRNAQDGVSAYEAAGAARSAPASTPTLPRVPNQMTPRHWDQLKQGLDDVVTKNRDQFGQLNREGGAANDLRKRLVAATEAAVPGLKEARAVWRGHTEELEALREGGKAFGNKTVEQVHRDMDGLSDTGRELYRQGAMDALKKRVDDRRDGNNTVPFVAGSPNLRKKLAAIAPDRATYNNLLRFLSTENKMYATKHAAVGNSATAERVADALDAERPEMMLGAIKAAAKLGKGHVLGALTTALHLVSKVSPEKRGLVLDEVRKVLLTPDAEAVRAFQQRMASQAMQAALPGPTAERVAKLVMQAVPRAITNQASETQQRKPAARSTR